MALAVALAMAPFKPSSGAVVTWVPNADGFWDIPANWNPGLPGALDDVILDVGGPTVRTITFRTNVVTVNSLASQENVFVTGGELTVSNAYANAQETRISGGILRLNGGSSLATFSQTGGTLSGGGVVTVTGAATYGSSAFQTGSGSTIHQGAVTLTASGGVDLDSGRLVEFRGGVTTTGGNFFFNLDRNSPLDGGTVRNAVGSTFTDSTSSSAQFSSSWGGGLFENLGTYRKTGAGTTTISVAFTNAGLLDIQAGTFALSKDSTMTGDIALASGATLLFQGGTHALNGVDFTGDPAGIFRVSGGTVTATGAIALPTVQVSSGTLNANDAGAKLEALTLSGGTFNFGGTDSIATFSQTGGTLAGAGVLTVTGAATYGSSAFQTGSGSTIHQGAVTLTASGGVDLDSGRLVEFRGGVTTTGGNFFFNLDRNSPLDGGTVRNAVGSTFTDSTSSSAQFSSSWGGGLFENLGTYRKTGAGTTTINVAFTNAGLLDIQAGTFALSKDSTMTGGIALASGAILQFSGGTHSLNAVDFTGDPAGIFRVSGGTVTATGAIALPTVQVSSGTLNANDAGAKLEALTLSGGTFNFGGTDSIATFSQTGGTLAGAGVLTVTGAATYGSSAFQTGSGSTIHQGAVTLTASGGVDLDSGRLVEFRGGVTTTGGNFFFNLDRNSPLDGGTVRNAVGSTFTDSTSSSAQFSSSWGGGLFENLGTYRKTGAGTTTISVAFTNAGLLDIQAGTFALSKDSTMTGDIALASGAILQFSGGTHSLNAVDFTGDPAGIFRVSGGTVTATGAIALPTVQVSSGTLNANDAGAKLEALTLSGGTFNFGGTDSIATFSQTGGTLAGAGVLTVTGAATYGSSAFQTGSGSTIHQGAVTLTASGGVDLDSGRLVEFRGGVTTTGGNFFFNLDRNSPLDGGTVRNAVGSTFTDSTSSSAQFFSSWGGGLFENLGTYRKTGAGTTTISVAFTNAGLLDIQAGTFALSKDSTMTGDIALASGAILQFSGGTHSLNAVDFTGDPAGIFRVSGGTVDVTGPVALPALQLQGGTLTLANTNTAATFSQTSGTLTGTGTLTVTGAATYGNSAVQTGSGSTIHQGAVTLTANGGVDLDSGRLVEFRGGVTTTGGNFFFNLDRNSPLDGGTVRNAVGSTFTDSTSSSAQFSSSWGGGLFENLGTYRKTGAGTTTINVAFTNAGLLDIQAGTFALSKDSTMTGGIALASGAILQFSGGTHSLNAVDFTGDPAGIFRVSGGTVDVTGPVALPALQLQGGTLTLANTNTAATFSQTSGTLTGTGTLTVTGAATYGNSAVQTGSGSTIHQGAVTLTANGGVDLDSGRLVEFRGGVTTTGGNFSFNLDRNSPLDGGTVRNAVGSNFTDSTSSSAQFSSSWGGGLFENLGTYRKTGAGTTTISVAFTNAGTVQVESGTFRIQRALTGASGTTLTSGTWVAVGPGIIDFETGSGLTSLVTNAADLTLSGAGSQIRSGASDLQLEATLTTNAAAGALRILNNRNYTATAGGGAFTNAGLLQLGGGTFGATSLTNSGTIEGFGSVGVAVTNSGTVRASGGSLTTLGINGSGAIEVASGASLDVSGAAANLTAGALTHNGTSLNLGTRNITVTNDYQNAGFGTGDGFNARTNVSGTGQINASSATQVLSAAGLTNGATANPTLNLGNRRVGDAGVTTVTISNGGATTTLRGAVADANAPGVSVIGGESFAIVAGGTATFDVGFVGAAPGSLAGQTILVANNFDNVADQTIALQGAVFRLGEAALAPDPVNLGNVRVGSTASGIVTISNTAIADGFSEGVRVTGATPSGNATAGAFSGGVIAAGGSANATVGINTAQAGSRTGTVSYALVSDGTGTSGLSSLGIGSLAVTVNASVYALANPNLPVSLAFGNHRVGDTAQAFVTVSNPQAGGVPVGFQEGLDITTGVVTGPFGGLGSVTNLAAGASNASQILVTLNTATAGAKAGTANYTLASNGTGTSGLAPEALPSQQVTLSGTVYRTAQQQVTGGSTVNARIGGTAQTTITISNLAANDGFSEGLGVTGTPSGSGVTFSDPNGLIAAAGSKVVTATFDTATAGQKTGTLSLDFASDGTGTSGLAPLALGSQDVSVTGNVFALANPLLLANLVFGNVQQGSVQTRTISVSNGLLGGVPAGFQEGLNAAFGTVSAGFSGSGAITNLGAGLSDDTTLVVTLDTSTVGVRTGSVQVLLASNGAGTSGLGLLDLGDVLFAASGTIESTVYRLAQAAVTPLVIDLGNRRVGDPAPAPVALTITNTAADDGFSERLDASVGATTGRAGGAGSISLLAPQASSNAISVGIDTSAAGANGTVQVQLASNGLGTSGFGITPLPSQTVVLGGAVYRPAEFDVAPTGSTIVARVGDSAGTTVTIRNTALADGFSEGLGVAASASGTGVAFTPAGGLIAAGGQRVVNATVDTATAGVKTGTLALDFTSDGAGTSGLAAIGIGSASATVDAQIYAAAVANVAPTSVNFGVVRVGDTVTPRNIAIGNGATGALTDTLVTSAGPSPAGFSAGPAPGPLAAGESGTIDVSLNTALAGVYGGDLRLDFLSRNPVLADLALGGQDVVLAGTVNNLAMPVFTRFGSALTFDSGLGGYVFDFGRVTEGGLLSLGGFGIGNLVFGPADDLSGAVTDPMGGVFSLAGMFDIGLLAAGEVSAPFSIFLDRSTPGSFTGQFSFTGLGTNASDLFGLGTSATLFLRAQIDPDTGEVPEPATWLLMLMGVGAMGAALRRRRVACGA